MKKMRNYLATAMMVVFGTMSVMTGSVSVMAEEDVLQAAIANLDTVTSMKGSFGIYAELDSEELSAETKQYGTMQETLNPEIYYMQGALENNLFDMSTELECFGEVQDGEWTSYYYADEAWSKTTKAAEEKLGLKEMMDLECVLNPENAVLSEETAVYNEKEVYVVTSSYDGAELTENVQKICNMMSDGLGSECDLSGVTLNVETLIYKDSLLPASVTMTVPEESLSKAYSGMEGMELASYKYQVEIQEYNTIDNLEIPEEALDAVAYGDNLEIADLPEMDKNDNYILSDFEKNVEVVIAPMEGYELNEYSTSSYLNFEYGTAGEGANWNQISYSVTENVDGWDVEARMAAFAEQEGYMETDFGYSDVVFSDSMTMAVDDQEIDYAMYTYTDENGAYAQYYAVLDLGNGYILDVNIYEEAYEGDCVTSEDTIKAAFEALDLEAES